MSLSLLSEYNFVLILMMNLFFVTLNIIVFQLSELYQSHLQVKLNMLFFCVFFVGYFCELFYNWHHFIMIIFIFSCKVHKQNTNYRYIRYLSFLQDPQN